MVRMQCHGWWLIFILRHTLSRWRLLRRGKGGGGGGGGGGGVGCRHVAQASDKIVTLIAYWQVKKRSKLVCCQVLC